MFRCSRHGLWTAGAALIFATQSLAALPPFHQSAREIIAILKSGKVAEAVGGVDAIESITKNETGYVLKTKRCSVTVAIESVKPEPSEPVVIGPPRFKHKILEAKCDSERSKEK